MANTSPLLRLEARPWHAAEYKHVALGLIFLKYISDAFDEQHAKLQAERAQDADPEDRDEYRAIDVFWVPPEARWSYLTGQEFIDLRSQTVTSSSWGGRRYPPDAFTDKGVAMLSSVLKSHRAIQANVEIMSASVRLRRMLAESAEMAPAAWMNWRRGMMRSSSWCLMPQGS